MVKCRIVSENQCLESAMKHGLLTCMRLNYAWQNSKFSRGGSIVEADKHDRYTLMPSLLIGSNFNLGAQTTVYVSK